MRIIKIERAYRQTVAPMFRKVKELTVSSLVAEGGYFFLLKEMIVKIITVKAVRNIPICVKSLSVMYTASPPFKVLWHFGR